ncbi:MAG TPA: hypothetical protein VLA12_10190 [Planctomycetaceae bacterium]|nr:hypothetical protein [Planctomycetaceae bacterium]
MPSQPVRLILAADLRLGQPLYTSISLTDSAREIVLDSTYAAWERLILEAVDRDVDLLILNGNSFVASCWSYHSEACLRAGLETLLAADIRVVVNPGPDDPYDAWKVFDDLDLQIFSPDHSGWEPIVGTSGCVLCEILRSDGHLESDARDLHEADVEGILRILLNRSDVLSKETPLPKGIDLAIHSGEVVWRRENSTDQLRLGCQSPQVAYHCSDPQGAVFLDSNRDRQIRASRLDTAAVSFLQFELDLTGIDSWEDAAILMMTRFEDHAWTEAERLRLIVWDVSGESPLALELIDGSGEARLLEAFGACLSLPEEVCVLHEFRPHLPLARSLFSHLPTPHLAEHFLDAFDRESSIEDWTERLNPVFESSRFTESNRLDVSRQLDSPQIARHATAVIRQWLAGTLLEDLKVENQAD